MSDVVDVLDKKYGPIARPIFVSCDPARDSVAAVKKYVAGPSLQRPSPVSALSDIG
jgi:cytochrome oxidase Cu insertion factor (SCO1/SenC/PrrC family)